MVSRKQYLIPKAHAIFIESTANGVSGIFYDLYGANWKAKTAICQCLFLGFTTPTTGSSAENFERTPEEEELVATYKLDDEQLMFRGRKIAQNGIDLFKRNTQLSQMKPS